GVSENITVRSILGKFLEHGRVYWFGPLEDPVQARCFIGSADMMGRNLDRRIEVVTPIQNPNLRKRIAEDVLALQLADNARTWLLDSDNHYTKLEPKTAKALVDSQRITCKKYKDK
ncbi:MAG TPA: RNA degradosome polyphosphate kinase, partial [Sutterella sp.]|nr:RNA degradosome polyphosphate kinase [Sutterella sp.]